jgi:predicted nuclease of predicted toxin-antitoxin system
MKILIDNNLPIALKYAFKEGVAFHVTEVLKKDAKDIKILKWCMENDYTLITTRDVDFAKLITSRNEVKCILCKTVNLSTTKLVSYFKTLENKIKYFNKNNKKTLEV